MRIACVADRVASLTSQDAALFAVGGELEPRFGGGDHNVIYHGSGAVGPRL